MYFKDKLILAPMAGVTNMPFRLMCRRLGADYAVSEMVSAKALWYGDRRSAELLASCKEEQPCAVQIFGSDPEIMAFGAKKVRELSNCPVVDINMGCPVPKVAGNGEGSALMKTPERIFDIVKAVACAVDVPVTVKMRAGFKKVNAVECALAAQEGGAAAVAVHAKTREQYYKPPVNFDIIALVKENLDIPVIGNGEIHDYASAKYMYERTNCDSIMIGRAALGNPYIFAEIKSGFEHKNYVLATTQQKMEIAREQLHMLADIKGEHVASLEARGQLVWYTKGIKGAARLRNIACKVSCLDDIDRYIDMVERECKDE